MSPLTQPTHRDVLAGRFELRSVLGRGGMSTVWSARDLLLGRDVAIKLLRDDLSEEHAGRIEREARAAARILDPRIVTVLDLHETEDGRPFLVLEPLTGRTLADELADGALDRDRVERLAEDLLGALTAAHTSGVLHRDIKPANVLVDGRGFRVTDFGIASVEDESATDGALVGTLRYIAPERFDGEPAREAGDVFSAAAVLYQAFSGEHPFAADDAAGVIARMRQGRIGSPDDDLAPQVRRALRAALDPDPARRPDPSDLLASLRGDGPESDQTTQPLAVGGEPTAPIDLEEMIGREARDGNTALVNPPAPAPTTEDGREHQPETEVGNRTRHRAEAADRFFTEFFTAAAHRLDHVADYRNHPKLRAARRRLRSSEALALIGGTILILVMLILVAGDDGTRARADEPGDGSTPAAKLDEQLDRIEEIG